MPQRRYRNFARSRLTWARLKTQDEPAYTVRFFNHELVIRRFRASRNYHGITWCSPNDFGTQALGWHVYLVIGGVGEGKALIPDGLQRLQAWEWIALCSLAAATASGTSKQLGYIKKVG